MAELELVKIASGIGAFGLIAVLILWVLFRGAPALQLMLTTINGQNAAAMAEMAADNRSTQQAMATAFKETVAALVSANTDQAVAFREALADQERACRAERAALWEWIEEMREADRSAWHNTADRFMVTVNNMYAATLRKSWGVEGDAPPDLPMPPPPAPPPPRKRPGGTGEHKPLPPG